MRTASFAQYHGACNHRKFSRPSAIRSWYFPAAGFSSWRASRCPALCMMSDGALTLPGVVSRYPTGNTLDSSQRRVGEISRPQYASALQPLLRGSLLLLLRPRLQLSPGDLAPAPA